MTRMHRHGMHELTWLQRENERLRSALQLIATGWPVAAGSAKPMPFKEWARQVASAALTEGQRE